MSKHAAIISRKPTPLKPPKFGKAESRTQSTFKAACKTAIKPPTPPRLTPLSHRPHLSPPTNTRTKSACRMPIELSEKFTPICYQRRERIGLNWIDPFKIMEKRCLTASKPKAQNHPGDRDSHKAIPIAVTPLRLYHLQRNPCRTHLFPPLVQNDSPIGLKPSALWSRIKVPLV